jgi:C-terminal processing protease CtpA/Prc
VKKLFPIILACILILPGSVTAQETPAVKGKTEDSVKSQAAELAKRCRELAEKCKKQGFTDEARELLETARKLEKKIPVKNPFREKPNLGVFDAVWEAVDAEFYDENFHGCDWDAMYDKYLPKAKAARSQLELNDICNMMLTELNASHCYLFSKYVWDYHFGNEFKGTNSIQAGMEIQKKGTRYFVRTVYDGGPAETEDICVGDEIVTINGKPAHENPFITVKDGISTAEKALFALRTETEKPITIGVRRKPGGAVIDKTFKPGETSMTEATRNSIKVMELGGKKVGYIHLWHYIRREIQDIFFDAIEEDLHDCDGLILDIRGRGGSPRVLFRILRFFTEKRWGKPAVLVIDEETASAKEIFAHYWKKKKLGTVVGLRTAGHVIGCSRIPMPNGSVMLVAKYNVERMTEGVILEGVGVEPDITVIEPFEYCAGRHPILKKAMDVIEKQLEEKKPVKKKKQDRWYFIEEKTPAQGARKAA